MGKSTNQKYLVSLNYDIEDVVTVTDTPQNRKYIDLTFSKFSKSSLGDVRSYRDLLETARSSQE